MKLKVKQDFTWAHRGVEVEAFKKGQVIDTDDADLIEVSTREKWTAEQGAGDPLPVPLLPQLDPVDPAN